EDDLSITKSADIKIIVDATTHGIGHVVELFVSNHFGRGGLFGVQNLAAQGQNSLSPPVSALLCISAGRLTLDDGEFGFVWVRARRSGEFYGEMEAMVDGAFTTYFLLRRPAGTPRLCSLHDSLRDSLTGRRALIQVLFELDSDELRDNRLDHI